MKKPDIFFAVLILILIAGAVFGLVSFCEPFVIILGNGSILKGILLTPFGIFGAVQFIRGALKVLGDDLATVDGKKTPTWAYVYVIFSIFSYFALIAIFRAAPLG